MVSCFAGYTRFMRFFFFFFFFLISSPNSEIVDKLQPDLVIGENIFQCTHIFIDPNRDYYAND